MNTANTTTNAAAITDINSVVLANLNTRRGKISTPCKSTADDISMASGADRKKLSVTFQHLNSEEIKAARSTIVRLVKDIGELTLPCPSIQGARYVKATDMDNVQRIVDTADGDLMQQKQEIVRRWDDIIIAAKAKAAQLAFDNDIEWPTAEEFNDSMGIELEWLASPAPIQDTVLETISTEVAARARASQAADKMFLKAHAAPVRELVKALAQAATATAASTQKGKRLKQANFDNIETAMNNVSSYNWLAIPELTDLVRGIKDSLGDVDGPSLPRDERVAVADKLKVAEAAAIDTLADLGI